MAAKTVCILHNIRTSELKTLTTNDPWTRCVPQLHKSSELYNQFVSAQRAALALGSLAGVSSKGLA